MNIGTFREKPMKIPPRMKPELWSKSVNFLPNVDWIWPPLKLPIRPPIQKDATANPLENAIRVSTFTAKSPLWWLNHTTWHYSSGGSQEKGDVLHVGHHFYNHALHHPQGWDFLNTHLASFLGFWQLASLFYFSITDHPSVSETAETCCQHTVIQIQGCFAGFKRVHAFLSSDLVFYGEDKEKKRKVRERRGFFKRVERASVKLRFMHASCWSSKVIIWVQTWLFRTNCHYFYWELLCTVSRPYFPRKTRKLWALQTFLLDQFAYSSLLHISDFPYRQIMYTNSTKN
jgi:hypothetical protein